MSLARTLLLGKSGKFRYESCTVQIDGQDVVIWFRSVTGAERDNFEESILKEKVKYTAGGKKVKRKEVTHDNIRAKLIALTACQGDGQPVPLFNPDDIINLGNVDASLLDPLFEVASRMAGMTNEDVKELEGN
jgi:hypothetical protein